MHWLHSELYFSFSCLFFLWKFSLHVRPLLFSTFLHFHFQMKVNLPFCLHLPDKTPKGLERGEPHVTSPWPCFDLCFPNYIQVMTPLPLGSNKWELGSGGVRGVVDNGKSHGRGRTSDWKCLSFCSFSRISFWFASCAIRLYFKRKMRRQISNRSTHRLEQLNIL